MNNDRLTKFAEIAFQHVFSTITAEVGPATADHGPIYSFGAPNMVAHISLQFAVEMDRAIENHINPPPPPAVVPEQAKEAAEQQALRLLCTAKKERMN